MHSQNTPNEANTEGKEPTTVDTVNVSADDILRQIGIDINTLLHLPEDAKAALEGSPETLIRLPHDKILEDLSKKQKDLEEAIDKITATRNEILSKLKEEKNKRDEFNAKVKEIVTKIKELIEKRNELQKHIDLKKQELNSQRQTYRELVEKLDALQKDLEGFSLRKEKAIRSQIKKYETILERFNIPPELEAKLVAKITDLSSQLQGLKEKEKKWKELNKLKQERENIRDSIGTLRKALVLYIQELNKVRGEIRELRKERDFYKSKADEHHREVQRHARELEILREFLDRLRELRYNISRTLNKLRKLKYQMRQFKEEEEFKEVVLRRLDEIKSKIEHGELDLPDLQFLVNFGFLAEDIFETLTETASPEEIAKRVARELGYQVQ